MRDIRRGVLGAGLLALALVAGACGSGGDAGTTGTDDQDGAKPSLTVGAVNFAENQIVAEMYAQVLEDAGYDVSRKTNLGSREVLQPAMTSGEIDIAPEYLASLLLHLDPNAEPTGDPQENVDALEPLLEEKGLELLEPSEANDTNALVVTPETAEKYDLETTSDLAEVSDQLVFGGPPECPQRPFCLPGLEETYGIEFKDFKPLDVGGPLTVTALENAEIDVALLFSTSSVIQDRGWVALEDDKGLQANESIAPVVRQDVLDDEIRGLLNSVSDALDTETMTRLNARVEIDKEDPADVARDFLEEEGLL